MRRSNALAFHLWQVNLAMGSGRIVFSGNLREYWIRHSAHDARHSIGKDVSLPISYGARCPSTGRFNSEQWFHVARQCCPLSPLFGSVHTDIVLVSWLFSQSFGGANCEIFTGHLRCVGSTHQFYSEEFRDTFCAARIWLAKVSRCLVVSAFFFLLTVRSVEAANAFIGPDGTEFISFSFQL